MRLLPLTVLLLSLALFNGCVLMPSADDQQAGVDDPKAWQQHQDELAEFAQWSLQGRVATGQRIGKAGDVNWHQQGEHFSVRVSGPLGAGGFRATGDLRQVTVQTRNDKVTTNNPHAFVEQLLGWPFPIQALQYWVLGLPAPDDYESLSVNAQGHLEQLKQYGWMVTYLNYQESEQGVSLPKQIVLDDGHNKVSLRISRWFNIEQK